MAEEIDILQKVKDATGISGDYQNATLNVYIEEVKQFLLDAGLKQTTVNGVSAVGVICRGVMDMWNYGAGEAKFSSYFMQRITQLLLKEKLKEDERNDSNVQT